jgi:hypothetical protein
MISDHSLCTILLSKHQNHYTQNLYCRGHCSCMESRVRLSFPYDCHDPGWAAWAAGQLGHHVVHHEPSRRQLIHTATKKLQTLCLCDIKVKPLKTIAWGGGGEIYLATFSIPQMLAPNKILIMKKRISLRKIFLITFSSPMCLEIFTLSVVKAWCVYSYPEHLKMILNSYGYQDRQ